MAKELTAHDAYMAHVEAELGIDPDDLTNPWHAAYASAAAFFTGAVIPLVVALMSPTHYIIPATVLAVIVTLMITGALSAHAGGAGKTKATIRVVVGGVLAMAITYIIGSLFNVSNL